MTQTFAATVNALLEPLSQARDALVAINAELASYDHPLYAGPCLEIVGARTFVEEAIGNASHGISELNSLQSRLVAGDPPRENVGTALDPEPEVFAPPIAEDAE